MIKRAHILAFYLLSWIALCFPLPASYASSDLDSQFSLESIGLLKSSDNMDGLFIPYLKRIYSDYFSKQTTFIINDLSALDPTLDHSNLPYNKLIMDREILIQISRTSHSQSLLRTRVIKEGQRYHFILDWLHAPQMEIIETLEFDYATPSPESSLDPDALSTTFKKELDKLISSIPFQGRVTGRDGTSVTINLGTLSGVNRGDVLVIGTLDDVKKHPLLKRIVEWKTSPTGKIEVEQADEGISFCKILEEEPGKEINRSQKVLHIQRLSLAQQVEAASTPAESASPLNFHDGPHTGSLNLALYPALYDRQYSNLTGISNTGGGLALGVAAQGEVLLTQEWFADLEFKFHFLHFSQKSILSGKDTPATANGGVSESIFAYQINLGYQYFLKDDLSGPRIWCKGGYKSNSYNLPSSRGEHTGPATFSSVFLGIGGDLSINHQWGAIADVNFRLLTSVTTDWLTERPTGTSDVGLYLAGYYRLDPHSIVRFGIDVVSNSATFDTGSTLSQKTVSIGPSLLYYF